MFLKLVQVCYPIVNYISICHVYLLLACEALKVGDNNILECKGIWRRLFDCIYWINLAQVGRSVTLTSGCVIGAKCSLTTTETLPENTVVFGSDHQRRTMPDRPAVCVVLWIIYTIFFSSSFKPINSIFSHVFYQHHIMFLNTAQKVIRQQLHRFSFFSLILY
jgi:hypothetical protein